MNTGMANPIGAMLSAAMLLRYSLSHEEAATSIERAVELALEEGLRTQDIAMEQSDAVSCEKMCEKVVEFIRQA